MVKPKILLIEDDRRTIELYQEVLKSAGLDVEVIDWCKTAIEKLKKIREGKEKKPDLVLLDLILPDMNGIYFLKEARKYPKTKDLKIFALTNFTDPELNKELIKEGIDKILFKTNYTPKNLIKLVKETLGIINK